MKADLATAIGAAIVGLLIAFFIANFFSGEIGPFSMKIINGSVGADLDEPDPEIFNSRALNPTVEVYIGSCIKYSDNGECVEILTEEVQEEPSKEPDENQENS